MDKPGTEGELATSQPIPGTDVRNEPAGVPAPPADGGARPLPTYSWWLVLCLVGLDYFSTLAYVPSMAVEAAGKMAPFAALLVAVVTLLLALPVYLYVVGRSPHGRGATGLLESHVTGWKGKFLVLVILGFVATDFVITRSLSTADAAKHLTHNPYWQERVQPLTPDRERIKSAFPPRLQGQLGDEFLDWCNEQLVVTVVLLVLGFALYFFLLRGFNRPFLYAAAGIVVLFLTVNGIVIVSGLLYLRQHPEAWENWLDLVRFGMTDLEAPLLVPTLTLMASLYLPQMALGLSGFELSMASASLIRGRADDDPAVPRGRIRNARKLLVMSALVMSLFLTGSVLAVTLLVPPGAVQRGGVGRDRALAYLAHGGELRRPGARVTAENPSGIRPDEDEREIDARPAAPADEEPSERRATEPPATARDMNPLFGPVFGTVYDFSTVLILCLAGASVSISLRDLVPVYLARYGMEMHWAQRVGLILHLFNLAILVVIVVFQASVSHQQGAYATSVLVLLGSAALAAAVDVSFRRGGSTLRSFLALILLLVCAFFLFTAGVAAWQNPAGLVIALVLVAIVLVTAAVSRYVRSTELRFEGFVFADETTRQRWEEVRLLDFQVLVPHRGGERSLAEAEADIRARHRLTPDVPILFVEAELGDPSNFAQQPLMEILRRDGREVIRVSNCASVAHVLAAMALEFRGVGRPPEVHFGWSDEAPLAGTLHFLLFGEGNVPLLVHSLIRKAEPDPARQPRVVIG